MKMSLMRIDLEPVHYVSSDFTGAKLKITVWAEGKDPVTVQQLLAPSDFESLFDFTFTRAKKMLQSELTKLEEKEKLDGEKEAPKV